MSKNKSHFFSRFTIETIMVIFSLFKLVPSIFCLIEYEAKDAIRSIFTLIILFLLLGTLILSTWLGLLTMGVIYLISLHFSLLLALFIIVVINMLLLVITAGIISRTKNHLYFNGTRRLLNDLRKC